MKLSKAKQGLRSLLSMVFIFGGLFFLANSAQAQNYNWKPEPEATAILDGQLDQLSTTLAGYTPGTPAYRDTWNHLEFYKLIHSKLVDGVSTGDAVSKSLPEVNDAISAGTELLPKATLKQLLTDAAGLLAN